VKVAAFPERIDADHALPALRKVARALARRKRPALALPTASQVPAGNRPDIAPGDIFLRTSQNKRSSAERAGFESAQRARVEGASLGNRGVTCEGVNAIAADRALNTVPLDLRLDLVRSAPAAVDAVEAALATALERATAAGRFDVVAQLARELEARRLARMGNVIAMRPKERPNGV
jgi:hypothetical protein